MPSRSLIVAGLILSGAFSAASQTSKAMGILQTRLQVRMGEAVQIPVDGDSLQFVANAKTRRVLMNEKDVPGVTMAPDAAQDQLLLSPSVKATPGSYTVTLSATSQSGEEMRADVALEINPPVTVPTGSSRNPVVLINGWEMGWNNGNCPIAADSTTDFGNLASYLVSDGVPVVYLFDNCAQDPGQTIETLGGDLTTFLDNITYSDGTSVPEIDLVAHSMGGLIARAYLEGLQTNESYLPPYNPRIAHLVLIATPNFGSFLVGNLGSSYAAGTQGGELLPGSALLWNLATWNQRGDDLAGVNTIAIVGNAGQYYTPASTVELNNASDGLVSTTSASLGFVLSPVQSSPTRIIPYCQVDPAVWSNSSLGTYACDAPGIADDITSTSHPTGIIVRSFLAGTTDWQSVGTAPSSDEWLKTNGGAFFALQNATAGYAGDLTAVEWGNVAMTDGGNTETIYYTDFVAGTALSEFAATSTSLGSFNCGYLAVKAGTFQAYRCKINLAITCEPGSTTCDGAITPMASGVSGVAVTSGSTLTIAGEDFGPSCGNCTVSALPAGDTTATTLTITSWTTTAIKVQLPSSLTGYQTITVDGEPGLDAMGVRAMASSTAATLVLSPASMSFAYTAGGTAPANQTFTVSNSGAGSLSWTATVPSADSWISVSPASGTASSSSPATVTVTVSPGSLSAGTYTGTVQIASTGATNTPALVTVTLVVTAAAPPPASLAVSPQSLSFAYTAGGTVPAAQSLSIANSGGGSFTWVASSAVYWAAVSAPSGAVPGTVNVSVVPQNLAAGSYTTTVTIAAADNSVTPVSVSVSLTVTGTEPTPAVTAMGNAASYQTNFAAATWVAIFGTNLSQITYSWQTSDIVNGNLPTSLEGVSVTVNGIAAYISYISPTQINVLAPDDSTIGSVPVVVTVAGQNSNSFSVQKAEFSPAFLTFNGAYAAAEHLTDFSLLAPSGFFPDGPSTPAAPGETVILYGVGFGPASPAVPTGQTVTTAESLANTVTVTIGGVAVTPLFSGLSASGLYQFNVTVPSTLTTGNAAVVATIGGVSTQTGVVIPVQQ